MSKLEYLIVKQPLNKYWKDEGGKTNNLHFNIQFNNIPFKKKDIQISFLCNNKIISEYDSTSKMNYEIKKINIQNKILEITFKIYKVSRRFDDKPFKIKIFSKFFDEIISNNIIVCSKRKKRKFKLINDLSKDYIVNGKKIKQNINEISNNEVNEFSIIKKQINLLIKELISTKKELISTKKELINTKDEINNTKNELDLMKNKFELKEFSEKIFDYSNDFDTYNIYKENSLNI